MLEEAGDNSALLPLELSTLEGIIRNINLGKYIVVAALTIWAYDFILTLSDEVELFWRRNDGNAVKALYMVVSDVRVHTFRRIAQPESILTHLTHSITL
jgi:hypothetical protein